ncbi:hypothetical protein [uncultured Thomasclavelia sp.]|uniref:hypothetical protein n=1 Tax=uncultured Thomasclavelia sp. TaxID=3025759 RepID=UPI00280A60DD|nr:hypothetical protein [uncultured Thomasclavelia sp.]
MRKSLFEKLSREYEKYNHEYESLYIEHSFPNINEVSYIKGKCYALYEILMYSDTKFTTSVINDFKVRLRLNENDYKTSLEHYCDEAPEYEYLNHPMYYKGCMEIYKDVIQQISK